MFLIIAANLTLPIVVFAAIIGLIARAIRPALAQASAAQVIKLERTGTDRLTDQPGSIRRAA
jgi:hypothetical protein